MNRLAIKFCVSVLVALMMIGEGCKKDSTEETSSGSDQSTMDVRMTDGPGEFDKVYLDIREVWVNIEGKGWVMVGMTRVGKYNILAFNNGDDTLIASMRVAPGKVKQIKLVLGTENQVVVNGTMQVIDMSSVDPSTLVIDVDESFQAGERVTLWIDIDAGRSVFAHLGGWRFRPWMRCYTKHKTGSIKGDVEPDGAAYFVYAVPSFNVNDTFGTYLKSNGEYRIMGLKAGNYNVSFINRTGAVVKNFSSVSVSAGKETDMHDVHIP